VAAPEHPPQEVQSEQVPEGEDHRRQANPGQDWSRLQLMPKYVLAYTGGSGGDTAAQQERIMGLWMDWFESLGESLVDGGSPFGQSAEIMPDGSVSDRAETNLTGYSIINADTMDEAIAISRTCPVLETDGSIDLYEALEIG
jgi:hypothetical protein